MCSLLLGIADLFTVTLIVLPLYPKPLEGYIYAVSLPAYTETAAFPVSVYWMLFLALIAAGIVKILLTQLGIDKGQHIVSGCSFALSILTVLLLSMTREPYATTMVFLLLIIKGILLLIHTKNAPESVFSPIIPTPKRNKNTR